MEIERAEIAAFSPQILPHDWQPPPHAEGFSFSLFDIAGRIVRQETFSAQHFDFQRNNLPNGLYFYKIEDGLRAIGSGKIILMN